MRSPGTVSYKEEESDMFKLLGHITRLPQNGNPLEQGASRDFGISVHELFKGKREAILF